MKIENYNPPINWYSSEQYIKQIVEGRLGMMPTQKLYEELAKENDKGNYVDAIV